MTPIEHQVLSSVRTLLEASQRPTAARIAEIVGRSVRQTSIYLDRLDEQGYLAPHDAWLRVPTALGMQAISRGPDELSKGPGRPKMGLGRPAFTMLLVLAYGTIEQQNKLRKNPHMKWANLTAIRGMLVTKGYLHLVDGNWCVTETGLKYLDEMRLTNHPWWVEGLT